MTIHKEFIDQIIKQMEENKWLTDEQNQWISQDAQFSTEQNNLAEKLNQ